MGGLTLGLLLGAFDQGVLAGFVVGSVIALGTLVARSRRLRRGDGLSC